MESSATPVGSGPLPRIEHDSSPAVEAASFAKTHAQLRASHKLCSPPAKTLFMLVLA